MHQQREIRFTLAAIPGESRNAQSMREQAFNKTPRHELPPAKLLADLLKRQARVAMQDVTTCPPDALPAHIARLDMLRDLMRLVTYHELVPSSETHRSDKQLIFCSTVADFLACVEITRQQHRAPIIVTDQTEFERDVIRRLDLLAGLIATPEQAEVIFGNGGAS